MTKHRHAVIFDLFGTLIAPFSLRKHDEAVRRMAGLLGAPPDDFLRMWNHDTLKWRLTGGFPTVEASLEQICQALRVPAEPNKIADATRLRIATCWSDLVPRAGALELLHQLKARGSKLGLISDCSAEVPFLWCQTAFAALIDAPVFSCSAGVTKPDPKLYRLACERLGVRPEDCLYVDDIESPLSGAARVGMRPIWFHDPADGASTGADWDGSSVSTLGEILALAE